MQQPQQVSFVLITFIQILLRPTEHYITLTLAAASSSSSAAATSSLSSPEKVSSRSKTSTINDQSHQPTRGGGLKKNALMESMKNLSEMEIEDDEEKGASAAAGKFMIDCIYSNSFA